MYPLVSIIALSYNHAPYIQEGLLSVVNQTYLNIEIIVVDDGSSDDSQAVIRDFILGYPQVKFFPLKENVGNCKAFNLGFKHSTGEYVVDFALDDVLLPDRIKKQVDAFEGLSNDYGVVFSDVTFIDQKGKTLGSHYKRDRNGELVSPIPQGEVYKELLEKYFISPPSMLVKREVFERLAGYDENLVYEDFDFWVRSSREFRYHYIDEIQTLKRVLPNSHGSKFSQKRQYKMLESTLKVCKKAYSLNKNKDEYLALGKRIRFHMRQAFFTENFTLSIEFYRLLEQTAPIELKDKVLLLLAKLKIPTFWIYTQFRK